MAFYPFPICMPSLRRNAERIPVTIRYPCELKRYGTQRTLGNGLPNMTWCDVMVKEGTSRRLLPARCCPTAQETFRLSTVEDQIDQFLDGKTHGETVLHALYDHVLDEPIPERMRLLLKR